MSLSTSASSGSFFGRGILLLGLSLSSALGLGHLAGRAYAPQPLSPSPEEVAASDHFVLILGNSYFASGIDPEALSRSLSRPGVSIQARAFEGGGWDAIHYYMLALLAEGALRPGRDAALLEVSAFSL